MRTVGGTILVYLSQVLFIVPSGKLRLALEHGHRNS